MSATGMYAELIFEYGKETMLYLFHKKEDAEVHQLENCIHVLSLTNEDLTELLLAKGIKPRCLNP